MIRLKVALEPGARLPVRGHEDDAGLDLFAREDIQIRPWEHVRISTGVHIELPRFFEAQVRGRSSMTAKGVVCPVGTVDSGYTGDIGVVLYNFNYFSIFVHKGDKIAQLVVSPVETPRPVEVEMSDISETDRGNGGFGSTGR